MISYILPTRNRPHCLGRTLDALASLPRHEGEVIVIDNASDQPVTLPKILGDGLPVRVIRHEENMGAAGRNTGARASDPRSSWLVLLDDDSSPMDTVFIDRLAMTPPEVAAVSADIFVPDPAHGTGRERGGLPEVFIGCGVAIRRDVFLGLGGYDPAFGYYAEEYDLAARILLAGGRVGFDPAFRVEHRKSPTGRNMDLICRRLVRNNGWVAQRYAPETCRRGEIRAARSRYRAIAIKERAIDGFRVGLSELRRTIRSQRRTPMDQELWDRFTGLSHARRALRSTIGAHQPRSVAIIEPGKNLAVVLLALDELGVRIEPDAADADALVIGTMSPGSMLDAVENLQQPGRREDRPVIAPWLGARSTLGPAPVGWPSG